MTLRPYLLVLLVLALFPAAAAAQLELPRKQVAAPPEDILSGRVVLPDPARVGRPSGSALVDVVPDEQGVFEARWPVATDRSLSFALLAPDATRWVVALSDAADHDVLPRLTQLGSARRTAGDWTAVRPDLQAQRWDVDGLAGADIVLRFTAPAPGAHAPPTPGARAALAPTAHTALARVHGGGPWRLRASLADWQLTADRTLVLRASIEHVDMPWQPQPAPGARMTLTLWNDGQRSEWPMLDDGRHDDGLPGDGLFAATLPPLAPGTWVARALATGTAPDGSALLLSDEKLLPVSPPRVALQGTATARPSSDALTIDLPVRLVDGPGTFHTSAEVWGTAPDGSLAPVAWASGMLDPVPGAGGPVLPLTLHAGWLARAGVGLPIQLREVRVQDPDTHVVLAHASRLPLRVERLPASFAALTPGPDIPAPWLTGAPGAIGFGGPGLGAAVTGLLPGAPVVRALMLVHGYCSTGVWPLAEFDGPLLDFLDANASRSHDEFAQLIGQLGAQVTSHGVVAHSQGGPASLHLLTYYWSGLDLALGGRRIQSVGAPYQGTPLAGDLAVLGQVFGAGCGVNDDLTYDGSALWLSGIPSWARAEVSYYTTSFSGLWCDFVTNLVLTNPEDGVVEQFAAQLPGAQNMGHVTGWCHTTGMSQPAQFLDHARNATMDAAAAH